MDVTCTTDTENDSESERERREEGVDEKLCTETSKALWKPQGAPFIFIPLPPDSSASSNIIAVTGSRRKLHLDISNM